MSTCGPAVAGAGHRQETKKTGDPQCAGNCYATGAGPTKTSQGEAVSRRRRRGDELTGTSWTDLGVNDGGHADGGDQDDAALCILERLIEHHLFEKGQESSSLLLEADAPWRSDLQHFVATIRSRYNSVPFHSYHHATHVTLSANKLMAALEGVGATAQQDPPGMEAGDGSGCSDNGATPSLSNKTGRRRSSHFSKSSVRSSLTAQSAATSGIGSRTVPTSLERVAFVFTALIHDVSHVGVSNAQLEMENHPVHLTYSDPMFMKSYAECYSVEIGLDLLRKEDRYRRLRSALFGSNSSTVSGSGSGSGSESIGTDKDNGQSFEELVRHLVMCTDIASAERRKLGMERFQLSFGESLSLPGGGVSIDETGDTAASLCSEGEDSGDLPASRRSRRPEQGEADEELSKLRRRTMLEQLMQLSDVSHLTQSWETFLKWNECLYLELIEAYQRRINEGDEDWPINGDGTTANGEGARSRPKTPPPHPSEGWYEDQIGFYDFYIIPLARRIEDCAFLDNSMSRTIVENAQKNRQRWLAEGKEATERMIASVSGTDSRKIQPAGDRREAFGTARRADSSNSLTAVACDSDASVDSGRDEESLSLSGLRSVGRSRKASRATSKGKAAEPKVNRLDANVPRVLAGQILDTIHERCRSSLAEANLGGGAYDAHGITSAQQAITSYWRTGSIMRYRACILMIDIAGFTHMAQMFAVDHFKNFINDYFTKIIGIISSHGGEVAKFAGDALYAVWTTPVESGGWEADDWDEEHATSVARSIACGAAINAKCNNYRVSRTYSRCEHGSKRGRRAGLRKHSSKDSLHNDLGELRLEGTVNLNADGSGYEEKVAYLNVHCGIAEGIAAGVNVCARQRSEFFFIGTPMADVAQAESLATAGELVISSSVRRILDANKTSVGTEALNGLEFVEFGDGGFFRVQTAITTASTASAASNKDDVPRAPGDAVSALPAHGQSLPSARVLIGAATSSMQRLVSANDKSAETRNVSWRRISAYSSFASSSASLGNTAGNTANGPPTDGVDGDPAAMELKRDIASIMESHSHESVRAVKDSMMPAELRTVVVLFIKVLYEPELPTNNDNDGAILDRFQRIFSTIHACLLPVKGQVRQFISDDKGTVCIASFGLRGSATLNLSATAVDAALKIQEQLLQITETECTIGVTLGKAFCGDIGCNSRHEFSIVGSSVNLSARLMAKGARGTINCDEALVANDTEHQYSCVFKHRLKGYDRPVPFYNPIPGGHSEDDTPADTTSTHAAVHSSARREETKGLIEHIRLQQELMEREEARAAKEEGPNESGPQPRAVLVSARAGAGKAQFIEGLLNHTEVKSRATILVANKCYHNTPFYCWVPIISRIVKTSKDVERRIHKLKRLRRKLLFPPSLLANAAVDLSHPPEMIDNNALVSEDLLPYLSLLNDFLFLGVPLFRPSDKVRSLKDAQKVDKAIDVLSSMVQRFIVRNHRPAIIAISDIDTIDDCSKQLVQNLFSSSVKLVLLCSTRKGTRGRRSSLGSVDSTMSADVLDSVFGNNDGERMEIMHLDPLGKEAIFEVFKSSLRGISEEDEAMIDWSRVAQQVHELCRGVVRHAIELAHAVSIELRRMSKLPSSLASDRTNRIVELLEDFPVSKMEELIAMRFDALSQEQQLLLKVASIPGINQHSFSLNLLETLMLDVSAGGVTGYSDNIGEDTAAGTSDGTIPLSVGSTGGSRFEDMFQGDNFEIMAHSLVEAGFLIQIDDENADYLSMGSTQSFRFASSMEQIFVNDLMLEDQKQELHLLLAEHYENRLLGLGDEIEFAFLDDDMTDGGGSLSTLTTTFTAGTSTTSMKPSWQIIHLTATHFSMAAASVQALLYYFEASTELARLGLRDKSHGSLLSAYSCFEQRLDQCRSNEKNILVRNDAKERNRLAKRLLQMICEVDVPPAMETLTQDHLRWMFDANSHDLVLCIKMLFKMGQSIGIPGVR